jgi:pathogenesis-related protein 1
MMVVSALGCGADDVATHDLDAAVVEADAAGGSPDAPGAPVEPPGLEGTVNAHNAARAAVGVGPLTWDPALAAIADAWVHQCVDTAQPIGLVDHNANRGAGYPTSVGENIYGSGGQASGTDAVALWIGEQSHYHHATNTCDAGQICGHYTQVVWRNTTKVGCALYTCPGLQYGSTVVCDYGPAGNFNGQSPY